jgi:hypothetical protein
MQEATIKHLEFIQAIIARLSSNSFLLKGWSVTLAAALFALAANDTRPEFAIVALFPALAFWGLDAYYLRQERLFRELYEDILSSQENGTGSIASFSMSTKKYDAHVPKWVSLLLTPTIIGMHGVVVLVVLVVTLSLFVSA